MLSFHSKWKSFFGKVQQQAKTGTKNKFREQIKKTIMSFHFWSTDFLTKIRMSPNFLEYGPYCMSNLSN